MAGIDDLPGELLASILRRLHDARELISLSRVSRRWRDAVLQVCGTLDGPGELCLRVQGRRDPAVIGARPAVTGALKHLGGLSSLVVEFAGFDAKALALALGDSLHTLELNGCPAACFAKLADQPGALASAALRNASSLRRLVLRRVDALPSAEVVATLGSASSLTHVDLSYNSDLRDDVFSALAAHCPSLSSLRVQGCWRLRGRGIAELAAGCPRLARLDLGLEYVRVTDAALEAIARSLGGVLEEFRMGGWGARPLPLAPSLNLLPRLTRLSALSFACDSAPESLLDSILRSCPSLARLRVQSGESLSPEAAARLAPLLARLTDVGLSTRIPIAAVGPPAPPGPLPLELLTLSCSPSLAKLAIYSDSVTNVCVLRSAPRWSSLRTLRLCSRHVTGPALIHMARHCKALRTLSIANAAVSDAEAAAAFAPSVPWTATLTRVDLSGTGAGDAALSALAGAVGPRLRGLSLYDTRVSDRAVCKWAEEGRLAGLESANLSRTGLADSGLAALLDGCPRLWRLYAFECRYLGPALARARSVLPFVVT
eukprot:tig00021374_g21119.t1